MARPCLKIKSRKERRRGKREKERKRGKETQIERDRNTTKELKVGIGCEFYCLDEKTTHQGIILFSSRAGSYVEGLIPIVHD